MKLICLFCKIKPLTLLRSAGYHSAYIAMLVGYSIKLAMVVVLYIYMWRQNKARDAEDAARSDAEQEAIIKEGIEMGMHDVTELDNRAFRYIL